VVVLWALTRTVPIIPQHPLWVSKTSSLAPGLELAFGKSCGYDIFSAFLKDYLTVGFIETKCSEVTPLDNGQVLVI